MLIRYDEYFSDSWSSHKNPLCQGIVLSFKDEHVPPGTMIHDPRASLLNFRKSKKYTHSRLCLGNLLKSIKNTILIWVPRHYKHSYSSACYLSDTSSMCQSKAIKPGNIKENQPWILFGRTDAEAKVPVLWPPDTNSWLIENDPDAGEDWRQKEKGMTEDEIIGWHHWFNGHELGQILGDAEGQGSLECCHSWGHEELDMTWWLNNNMYHLCMNDYEKLKTTVITLLSLPLLFGIFFSFSSACYYLVAPTILILHRAGPEGCYFGKNRMIWKTVYKRG